MKLTKSWSKLYKEQNYLLNYEYCLYPVGIEHLMPSVRPISKYPDSFHRYVKEECRNFKVPFKFKRV